MPALPLHATPAPKPPSASGIWLRRALRWVTGLLVVFALGLGATWLAQVQPLRERLAVLEEERASLESRAAELQALVAEMDAVRAENVSLKVGQARMEQHLSLLQAMTSTASAQVSLASGAELARAAAALSQADGYLAGLEQALAGSMQQDVRDLRQRLALAVGELESDPFAARRDLEVLANGLEILERLLSGA
jgi:hypothetical protein